MQEPILEIDEIQGNVFPGFRLPFQSFFGCRINKTSAVKSFFEFIIPQITNMAESLNYKEERNFKSKMQNVRGIASFSLPDKKNIFWLNIGLGCEFLSNYNKDAEKADSSFKTGMAGRSFLLGDPTESGEEGNKNNWLFGNDTKQIDIFLIAGSDNKNHLDANCERLISKIRDCLIDIIYTEEGGRLNDDKEHFGFKDGISQPGIRGYIDKQKTTYFYPREIIKGNEDPDSMEFSSPGKLLLWPGQFVFGYLKQSPGHFRKPIEPTEIEKSDFLRNGSFFVFRRLKQNVARFNEETKSLHDKLDANSEEKNIDYNDFIAQLVGRYKDGKPSVIGKQSIDEDNFNNFNFKSDTNSYTLNDGRTIFPVPADPTGNKCPMIAHIRKVNPRDLPTDQGAETNTATFRIIRRGIPFGAPYNHENPNDPKNNLERGLLFICYQTSIQNQFELLTSKWMNEDSRPETRIGFDMIVGQNNEEDTAPTKWCTFQNTKLETSKPFITTTGGGYFFSPSIKALNILLELISKN